MQATVGLFLRHVHAIFTGRIHLVSLSHVVEGATRLASLDGQPAVVALEAVVVVGLVEDHNALFLFYQRVAFNNVLSLKQRLV